jgi:STE24 endopeptidase
MSEMTATRMGWPLRGAAVILLIAAWAVGGTRLWRTSVPSSLRTSGLDVGGLLDPSLLADARHYSRVADLLWLGGLLATLAAAAIVAWRVPRVAGRIGLGPIGSGAIVGTICLVAIFCAQLPFSFAGQWWAARHDLAPDDYAAWLVAPWAQLAFEAGYALVAIVAVMALARRLGPGWWVAGAPLAIGLVTLFVFLQGWVAAAPATPLPQPYRADVAALERREGVDPPVHQLDVDAWTNQPNAFAAGLGPSTNVVVWNTLLDGRFSRAEVRVVLGHELGHVAHAHLWKQVGWLALIVFPLCFVLAEATRPLGGLGSPRAIPLAILVIVAGGILATPIENEVSRRYEAEADWAALQATRDPAAAKALFVGFARTGLDDPSPPAWAYWLRGSHPTLAQRIAMAERWATAGRRAASRAGS